MDSLYNWTPLIELIFIGTLLALLPAGWVLLRNLRKSAIRRYQALMVLTLFLTFDLILFGAFTRLTDSGLGCPDWPGCYGHATPLGASNAIEIALTAMPTGPVTHTKAWVEMVHRYLASGVGALILMLTLFAWRLNFEFRNQEIPSFAISSWLSTLTLFWVCVQGAFGAWTVTMKLFPIIVTAHLVGGLVLLSLLSLQFFLNNQKYFSIQRVVFSRRLRALAWVGLLVLSIQVLSGGWVSTNYAVLACSDFPKCQNSWWPSMNFSQGFEVWRELGMTSQENPIDFAALTAIHMTHRLLSILVFICLGLFAWFLNSKNLLRSQSRWLILLLTLQFMTGLSNVLLDWPLFSAVMHTGGAAALVLVLTWTLVASRTTGAGLDDSIDNLTGFNNHK